MSNTAVAKVNKVLTLIDRVGAYANILRKDNEDIEEYKNRVIKGYKELYELDNDSFYRMLGYGTRYQEYNIGVIDISEEFDKKDCNVEITGEKIIVNIEGDETILVFKDYKFLIDLVSAIENIEGLNFKKFKNEEKWKWLYSNQLVKSNSDKLLLNQFVSEYIVELHRDNVYGFNFWRREEDGAVLIGEELSRETNLFSEGYVFYKDFPVVLTWVPFKPMACNSEEFKTMIKDSSGNLTQKGAKIINKILEKQNTYWGE